MALDISDTQLFMFNKHMQEICGIFLTPDKKYLIKNRLSELIEKDHGSDFNRFLISLQQGGVALKKQLIELMTTRETFWFRDIKQFEKLEKEILQQFQDEVKTGDRRSLKIWSAACSSGQEPYTLAMVLQDNFPALAKLNRNTITASDISLDALEQAKKGEYGSFELSRGLPEAYKKYISGNAIQSKLKDLIDFKQLNLMTPYGLMGKFDIIFIRNVLIYFTDETRKEILTKMHKQLNKDGVLFLSTTERIDGLNTLFKKDKSGLFYRKINQDSLSLKF